MVSPKGPSKTEKNEAQLKVERLNRFGPDVKKFFPQFDKLTQGQQYSLVMSYMLKEPSEKIRKEGLNYLGVETEYYDRYREVPSGPKGKRIVKRDPLAQGGRVHRGRTASGSAEK